MSRILITASEDQPVKEIRRLMSYHHVSAVPVVSTTTPLRPLGIVTDTDLRNVSDAQLPAKAVMSTVLQCISPNASVSAAAKIMLQYGIHHLIVEEGEEIVGILSSIDLLSILADENKVRFARRMIFI